MPFKQLFTKHPQDVGETYLEHMRTALSFAGPLAKATGGAVVHAFLPFLCTTTASRTVKGLHARMVHRGPDRHDAPAPARLEPRNGYPAWDPVI